jgi:nucleotide-binding universal stress UspA family protein
MSDLGDPIVVGYVSTPEGDAALQRAIAEARHHDALLVVVNSEESAGEHEVVDGVEVDETMDPVTSVLADTGLRFDVRHVISRDPAHNLIEIAEEVGAGLIVIGLRKRTPVGKLIMGSNAQRILLNATCPVLAVKAS